MKSPLFLLVLVLCQSSRAAAVGPLFNARDHGAKGDGKADDTAAIQKTIDIRIDGEAGILIYAERPGMI
jgi:Pectate lyase superfamily protein